MMLKRVLRALLPKSAIEKLVSVRNDYFDGHAIKSYSQEGEDMILRRLFFGKDTGFYVDVGAHHPKRFSNTFFFYKRGWNGINIDAMPGSMKLFEKLRPRDINIEKPVSDKKEVLTYYAFDEPALNGFSKELSDERAARENRFVKFTKDIETSTLEDILDNNLPPGQEIDFLSIDVEGLDFKVLKSNNFEKYKPRAIVIEILESSLSELQKSEISSYLKAYNYSAYAKSIHSVVFLNELLDPRKKMV